MVDSAAVGEPEISQCKCWCEASLGALMPLQRAVSLTFDKVCPHTSFYVPWQPADCAPRESIEFRAYVFYGAG